MNEVEIDWYDPERDLDTAMNEFAEYWHDQRFEVQYNYEPDHIVMSFMSNMSRSEFVALVEGPEGLLDHLNDWTSRGVDVSHRYL